LDRVVFLSPFLAWFDGHTGELEAGVHAPGLLELAVCLGGDDQCRNWEWPAKDFHIRGKGLPVPVLLSTRSHFFGALTYKEPDVDAQLTLKLECSPGLSAAEAVLSLESVSTAFFFELL
jgi:hypothetical protein